MAVLKIAALFSYCGGPLFIGELLKPHIGVKPTFLVTFLPVGVMVLGALCLDDARNRWSNAAVWAGRQGLYIVLGMHLYALWYLVNGIRVPDQSLYYFGIAVGAVWSIAYLHAARRWMSSPGGLSLARDHDSTNPTPQ
jgi:hypothetical protein